VGSVEYQGSVDCLGSVEYQGSVDCMGSVEYQGSVDCLGSVEYQGSVDCLPRGCDSCHTIEHTHMLIVTYGKATDSQKFNGRLFQQIYF